MESVPLNGLQKPANFGIGAGKATKHFVTAQQVTLSLKGLEVGRKRREGIRLLLQFGDGNAKGTSAAGQMCCLIAFHDESFDNRGKLEQSLLKSAATIDVNRLARQEPRRLGA